MLIQTITLRPPQFQVATYAFLLGFITRDIRNVVIEPLGGIYLPSNPGTPKTFRLDFLLPRIESFFRTQLPAVLAQPQPRWLFNSKCRGCEYVDKCRQEAYDTIGMVPYLSEAMVKGLDGVDVRKLREDSMENEEITDVEDLGRRLENVGLGEEAELDKVKRLFKFRRTTMKSPYLEAYRTHTAQVPCAFE